MEADEFGSGGKIASRRKAAAAASPYFRPRLPSSSPANSIFSRLASGAGKVLSSIFIGGTSSSSIVSSSDDEIEDEDGMDCDIIADSNEIKGLSEREAVTAMTNNDRAVVNQLIFQKSDTNFAKIKKLLAQETFSREECTRLVKIIQSRVMDHPTLKVNDLENGQNDSHARAIGSKTASVRTWWSLPETRKSSAPFTFSNNSVNASSPSRFGLRAEGLHLHNAAIMKARRWIEEKKLESTLMLEKEVKDTQKNMSTGLKDGDVCPRSSDMIDPNTAREVDGKLSPGDSIETCEPLNEASVDVPSLTETKNIKGRQENDCIKKSDEKTGLQSKEMLRARRRGKKARRYYRSIKGKR